MEQFKGSKEVHAVNCAGFIILKDEPYYEGLDILNIGDVGEDVANANAKLYEAAPDLLEALQDLVKYFGYLDEDSEYVIKAKAAINKALK